VDPTGTGDAFCAGVIYKIIEKYGRKLDEISYASLSLDDVSSITLFAQAVGASACTAPGTTNGVNKDTIMNLLQEQGEDILRCRVVKELK